MKNHKVGAILSKLPFTILFFQIPSIPLRWYLKGAEREISYDVTIDVLPNTRYIGDLKGSLSSLLS